MGFYVGGKHSDSINKLLEAIRSYVATKTGMKLDKVYLIFLALRGVSYIPDDVLEKLANEAHKVKNMAPKEFEAVVEKIISELREKVG